MSGVPSGFGHISARKSEDLFSSKEFGEPPMVLANSVFFAIKSAVRASRKERKLPENFPMTSPASVQTIAQACEVTEMELAMG